jgi:hypothetical protein
MLDSFQKIGYKKLIHGMASSQVRCSYNGPTFSKNSHGFPSRQLPALENRRQKYGHNLKNRAAEKSQATSNVFTLVAISKLPLIFIRSCVVTRPGSIY